VSPEKVQEIIDKVKEANKGKKYLKKKQCV
jgi:hypothetical protein